MFTVDRSGCKGQLDCKVVSPSGHEDDCFAQYLDEDTYSVRFLPKENGIHQVSRLSWGVVEEEERWGRGRDRRGEMR